MNLEQVGISTFCDKVRQNMSYGCDKLQIFGKEASKYVFVPET
jgi:hypothetical protein